MPSVSSIVTSSVLSADKHKAVPRRKFLPEDIGDLIREVTGRKTAEKNRSISRSWLVFVIGTGSH